MNIYQLIEAKEALQIEMYNTADRKLAIQLIDNEIEKLEDKSMQKITILKCQQKLLIAVGYAESIESSDDYQNALDLLVDYALRYV